MATKFFKNLADPVHGTIGLTKLEIELLETAALQRLRNVKQLGLAHYVYPGADFSRLSHSIGVCHLAGQKIRALNRNGANFSDEDELHCRAAALLHDIGHFPFSHAMEVAVSHFYKEKESALPSIERLETGETNDTTPSPTIEKVGHFDHELIGRLVVTSDEQIKTVISQHNLCPHKVAEAFGFAGKYSGVVKSELDADRLDFLPRTALHTGLPYGSVDLRYILSNLVFDQDHAPCLHEKAIRAAEHFLLCRLFDRQQVAYHKSVAGFEMILKEAIKIILGQGRINCSSPDVKKMIEENTWSKFDDSIVTLAMRAALNEAAPGSYERDVLNGVLHRKVPKQVYCYDALSINEDDFKNLKKLVNAQKRNWAKESDIQEERLLIWEQAPKPITKGEPIGENPDESIWIRQRCGKKLRLIDVNGSVIKQLVSSKLYSLRVYYVTSSSDSDAIPEKLREKISESMS